MRLKMLNLNFRRILNAKSTRTYRDALEHIHVELKRLNDTNPSNQAQAKPKQDKKKSFEPKNFI